MSLLRRVLPLAALGGAVWYLRSVYRYRDPVRIPDVEVGAFLSPADGVVSFVRRIQGGQVEAGPLSGPLATPLSARALTGAEVEDGWLLGLFVGPLDVHYVYAPASGTVRTVHRTEKGANVPLADAAATLRLLTGRPADLLGTRGTAGNARYTVTLTTGQGNLSVTLVAGAGGLKAISYARPADELRAGHKLAFLDEGGLVLLTLPAGVTPQVSVGDHVRGAQTVLARLS